MKTSSPGIKSGSGIEWQCGNCISFISNAGRITVAASSKAAKE